MDDAALLEALQAAAGRVRTELAKAIVGQADVIEQLLIALFARGHALLIGVPGLAKTLLISSLADVLNLSFQRIQFTPDLLPSDVTGTDILQENPETRERSFRFVPGPLFANLLLADEVNRTPPKTQSALLQAMQEGHVTVLGRTYPLPVPFYVLATQNPIEQEGTYLLPEAQLDRFLLQIDIGYPSADDEARIVEQTTGPGLPPLAKVLSIDELRRFQDLVRRVPIAETPLRRAVDLTRRTRPGDPSSTEFIRDNVAWGAGPRAAQSLVLAAKVRCLLRGRATVSWEDIAAVAAPVLRHRLILSFRAQAEGRRADEIVHHLLETSASS